MHNFEEQTKQHYPTAIVEKVFSTDSFRIMSHTTSVANNATTLGEGKTEVQAWESAAQYHDKLQEGFNQIEKEFGTPKMEDGGDVGMAPPATETVEQETTESAILRKTSEETEKAVLRERTTIPYQPESTCPALACHVPVSMFGDTLQMMNRLKAFVGNIDDYLIEKLQYGSKLELCKGLSGEQADSVALSIYNIEQGQALILGDMAGIGKGRVCGAIQRYAYLQNKIPVFITEGTHLFTPMYWDIMDIGGLGDEERKPVKPKPFIINGFKSRQKEVVFDANGKKLIYQKPSETSILDRYTEGRELIVAPLQSEVLAYLDKAKLPAKFNCIFMTYSQIQSERATKKLDYLKSIAENCIFIFDESHNASGEGSNISISIAALISMSGGVMFSSATFAKRVSNLTLYASKTAIGKSNQTPEQIEEVVNKGGEKIQEYLASNLARAGNLIRRERAFDNCSVDYAYMGASETERAYNLYDRCIEVFNSLHRLESDIYYINAKREAAKRFAQLKKVEVAFDEPSDKEERKRWKDNNKGKFRPKFNTFSPTKNRFYFIETLLFSIKAESVATLAIQLLSNNALTNTDIKGQTFLSNQKPVIAIRSTLETIWLNAGIALGEPLKKYDFSILFDFMVHRMLLGGITLQEILTDEDKKDPKIIAQDEWNLEFTDFEDKGKQFQDLIKKVQSFTAGLPASPIDYIIEKIQSTQRPEWDNKYNSSPFYSVAEVTGRNIMIRQKDGIYYIMNNNRERNKASSFEKFNRGEKDVLLINEAGATGMSAHSSENFRDQRPRCMILHQVELDVNTDVQKRFRIYRTGMVNYPGYIYAISPIPAEVRRLLMLKRKLRSLDANTTANMKQTAQMSEIKDAQGQEIRDVYNKYGELALQEFLDNPANESFKKYDTFKEFQESPDGKPIRKFRKSDSDRINKFCMEIELATSAEQRLFYDSINFLYENGNNGSGSGVVDRAKKDGTYDLETEVINYRASIRNRILMKYGSLDNPFNYPVYAEDDYVTAQNKHLNKEQLTDYISEINEGQDPKERHRKFRDEYNAYMEKEFIPAELKRFTEKFWHVHDKKNAEDKEQYERTYTQHEKDLKTEVFMLNYIFSGLPPTQPSILPDISEEERTGPQQSISYNLGIVVGYRIRKSALENRFSPSNIEIHFATMEGLPTFILKPIQSNQEIFSRIITDSARYFKDVQGAIEKVKAWVIKRRDRYSVFMLTGNILEAYGLAEKIVEEQDEQYYKNIRFIRFTTMDEAIIRSGIELKMRGGHKPLNPDRSETIINVNSPEVYELLKANPKIRRLLEFSETPTMFLEKDSWEDDKMDFELRFYAGVYKRGWEEPKKSSEFISKYVVNKGFRELMGKMSLEFNRVISQQDTPKGRRELVILYLAFDLTDENDRARLMELLTYIFNDTKAVWKFFIRGGEESIKEAKDPYEQWQHNQQKKKTGDVPEERGIFQYYYALPPKAGENIPNVIGKEESNSAYPNGKLVTTFRKLSVSEARAYRLVPINPTAEQAGNSFFDIFDEVEGSKARVELAKLVEDKVSGAEVGAWASKKVNDKGQNTRFIFGDMNNKEMGDALLIYQGSEADIRKKRIELKVQQQKHQEIKLDMDSAQDFLIALRHMARR